MLGLRRVEQCCTKLVPLSFNINKILEINVLQKSSHNLSPVIISDANFQTLKSHINRYKLKYCFFVYIVWLHAKSQVIKLCFQRRINLNALNPYYMIGQPSVIFLKISSSKEHENFDRGILWRNLLKKFLCQSNLNEFVLAVFEKHAFSCQIH